VSSGDPPEFGRHELDKSDHVIRVDCGECVSGYWRTEEVLLAPSKIDALRHYRATSTNVSPSKVAIAMMDVKRP
jgi:hypothetical protein